MQTTIGQNLRGKPGLLAWAAAVGLGAVAADLLIVWGRADELLRGAVALVALSLLVSLTEGDLGSTGLRLVPKQGWGPWVWWSLIIGLIVGACVVVGLGLWVLLGFTYNAPTTPPERAGQRFLEMCVIAPTVEEAIYRVALCVPLVPLIGGWKTVVVNGVVFGALHVVYGNPSPENLVGGLFLAWAYLHSETIVLPVALHAIGNFIALSGQVAGWHLLRAG
jgi:membrane protease YdiL (CAAX protease family)